MRIRKESAAERGVGTELQSWSRDEWSENCRNLVVTSGTCDMEQERSVSVCVQLGW